MLERVAPPPDGCPLHDDVRDHLFVRSPHFPVPICGVCAIELDHYCRKAWPELSERRQQWVERIEAVTGRWWGELRTEVLESQLSYWETLERDQSGPWIDSMLRHGWSQERCVEHVRNKIEELQQAYARLDRE